jgi:hypothetical protein
MGGGGALVERKMISRAQEDSSNNIPTISVLPTYTSVDSTTLAGQNQELNVHVTQLYKCLKY